MVEKFTNVCVNKTKQKTGETFLLAILAGMFIAFGASSSNLAIHAIENAGLAKLVAGTIFPVGLMLIVTVAGELFTGDCMLVFGNFAKRYSVKDTIVKLVLVYFGNLVGSVMIALLLYGAGQFGIGADAVGAFSIKVAYGKLQYSFGQCVASGILCNILVCAAVLMASKVESVPGKMFAVFFPIFAFVIGGFEHCVANMYYLPAGYILSQSESYAQKAMELYGYSAQQIEGINVSAILVQNLIPVTIGNMLGGMIFVALPLYLIDQYQRRK